MPADDHLNAAQHGKYVLSRLRDGARHDFLAATHYYLHHGDLDVGSMTVLHHPQTTGEIVYPTDPAARGRAWDTTTTDPEQASWKGHDQEWADVSAADSAVGWRNRDVQIPLFRQSASPPRNEVYIMTTAKQHRAMAGTMLGVANRDAEENTGHGLSSTSNLSKHSMQMVSKLADRGVVPRKDVPAALGNEMTFDPPLPNRPAPEGSTPVSREDMERGRKAFRDTIRSRPQVDPNQGRLF